jgi:hypothetical protein
MVVRMKFHTYQIGAILWALIFGQLFEPGEIFYLVLFLESIVQFLFAQLIVQLLAI